MARLLFILATTVIAVTGATRDDLTARAISPYAPDKVACPSSPLVREANGINAKEQSYFNARKPIATAAFKRFLSKTGVTFPELPDAQYPTIALTSSGGGYRALLIGAGVHKALDNRDGNGYSTAGLYQSLAYEAGLSGGGWLLSSIAGNGYPTITSLQNNLWKKTFAKGLGAAGGLQSEVEVIADVQAKKAAGFPVSLVDPYGREVGYTILQGAEGGVAKRFSDIANLKNFTSHQIPFPIITATGIDTKLGQCEPPANGTQYETSPFEFGSWDDGVRAFAQTKYIGSFIDNGKPRTPASCYTGFDNAAFIFGTSSDIFPGITCLLRSSSDSIMDVEELEALLPADQNSTKKDARIAYAKYINPFHNYAPSTLVKSLHRLTLADGGLSDQNNPIWPFLHRPEVNILLVNDNSADTSMNYPNGSEIYNTYTQAKLQGLGNRMPVIPNADTFVAKELNTHPTFFGCNNNDPGRLAIVFLPNVGYNGYNSGKSTFMTQYPANETVAMIKNGGLVATGNKDEAFGTCVACLAMKKKTERAGKTLPKECKGCFELFCYN